MGACILSMDEVPGSIPGRSTRFCFYYFCRLKFYFYSSAPRTKAAKICCWRCCPQRSLSCSLSMDRANSFFDSTRQTVAEWLAPITGYVHKDYHQAILDLNFPSVKDQATIFRMRSYYVLSALAGVTLSSATAWWVMGSAYWKVVARHNSKSLTY